MKLAASQTRPNENAAAGWFARPPRIGALALLLLVLIAGAFLPVLHNGFVNFDDEEYVVVNRHVQAGFTAKSIEWAFTSTIASNWHPVTWLSHMLDCKLYGLNPAGHHLTSLLIHAANALLVLLIFARMTGDVWRSFFVAAIFAIHPLRVESVAWVSERKDVLSAFFWLLTMWCYFRYVGESKQQSSRAKIFYCLSLLCFVLGLMSKPVVVTLPCALLLLDYWPLERSSTFTVQSSKFKSSDIAARLTWKALFLEKIPFFMLTAALSVVTFLVQKHGGAVASISGVTMTTRLENIFVSYARYLGKMFWPTNLAVLYTLPTNWPAGTIAVSVVVLAVISIGAVLMRRERPCLLAGWLWFLGTLVPMIGLVQVGEQSMADRYTYIPGIGVLIMIAWSAPEWAGRLARRAIACAGAAAIIALCAVTREQTTQWKDSETLFRHALAVNQETYGGRVNLGNALARQGRIDEAIANYRRAIQLQPETALGYDRLAAALRVQGRLDEARQQFEDILKLSPTNADAENEIGATFFDQGKLDQAIACYRKAVAMDSNSAATHFNWGIALCYQNDYSNAVGQLQQAVKLDVGNGRAHYNLGIALFHTGKLDDAIREFTLALALDPNAKTHYRLGVALAQAGRRDDAIAQLRAALVEQPNYPEAAQELERLTAPR